MIRLHDDPRFNAEAVLFDLDGVLVDSRLKVEEAWRTWARSRSLDADAVVEGIHGRRAVDSVRRIAPSLDPDVEVARIEALELELVGGTTAMPGAVELVAGLEGPQWTVVTSGSERIATARLRAAGLPIPACLVHAGRVTRGKPHPEGYLLGAELLGVDPGACVVVEDAPAGVTAARAAGMRCIAVTTTVSAEELGHAHLVLSSLLDLGILRASRTGKATVRG